MSLQGVLNKKDDSDYLDLDITSQEFEENYGCRVRIKTFLPDVPQTKLNTFYLLRKKFDDQKQYWKPQFMIQIVGLRRSGKTIALQQLYNEEFGSSAIITGIKETNISLIGLCKKLIEEYKVKNIFIDEITYFKKQRVDETMRHLFTVFVESGRTQFIVTGTESTSIAESNKNYMFGRSVVVKFSPTWYKDFSVVSSSSFLEFFESEYGYKTDEQEVSIIESISKSLNGYLNEGLIIDDESVDELNIDGNKLYILLMIYFSIIDFSDKTKYKYIHEIFKKYSKENVSLKFTNEWFDGIRKRNFKIQELLGLIGARAVINSFGFDNKVTFGIIDPRLINVLFRFLGVLNVPKIDLDSYKGIAFETVVYGQILYVIDMFLRKRNKKSSEIYVCKLKLGRGESDICILEGNKKKVLLLELKIHTLVENKYLFEKTGLKEYLLNKTGDSCLENFEIKRIYVHGNSKNKVEEFCNCEVMFIDNFLNFLSDWLENDIR